MMSQGDSWLSDTGQKSDRPPSFRYHLLRAALSAGLTGIAGLEGIQLTDVTRRADKTFDLESLVAVARKAIERGTGAHGLRSVLEALLKRTMFDSPSNPDIKVCRVDAAAVVGESDIELETSLEQQENAERLVG